jgi:hypothetical protein
MMHSFFLLGDPRIISTRTAVHIFFYHLLLSVLPEANDVVNPF